MVTKLSGTVVEYSAEGMFQYEAGLTSGLSVTVSAGSFMEEAGLVEYAETSFTLTDDAVNYIFINLDVTPATLVASITLPAEGLILFRITTASGVVSAVKDFRNRQFASRLLVPPVGNQVYEALADADHFWDFKDFTTPEFEDVTFTDGGTSSSPVDIRGGTSNSPATNVPGPTRGTPFEPAAAFNESTSVEDVNVNFIANSATGAWGLWIKPIQSMATYSGLRYPLMVQRHVNNSGLSVGFAINPDGSLQGWVDSNANQVFYNTASGLITPGEWNHIVFNQPGDAGGCKFYVNGAVVTTTPTTGGTGSLDDWTDRLYADFGAATDFSLITYKHVSGGTIMPCHVFAPFVYETGLTATKIQEIYDATNITGDPEDVRTWIIDNIGLDYHWSMSFSHTSNYCTDFGKHQVKMQSSGTVAQYTGPWTDTDINHFHNNAQIFSGSGNPTFFPNGNPNMDAVITDTVGSWGAWVKTPASLTTARRFIGAGANYLAQTGLGMTSGGKFYGTVQRSSGNAHTLTASGITLSADTWYFVVLTQDGSSMKLYIDGAQVTGGDLTTSTTGTGTVTDWHNDVPGWTSDSPIRISGAAGSSSIENWSDGAIGDFFYHSSALTATQISNMHDAANGTFA